MMAADDLREAVGEQLTLTEQERARFWHMVEVTATCWLWTGSTSRGYGRFSLKLDGRRTNRGAHRISYVARWGAIPAGMVVDHICRVRNCVNPDHLRLLTAQENTSIGVAPTAINARKTHCIRGHEFTPENTYVWARRPNERACKACRVLRRRTCELCGKEMWRDSLIPHLRNMHGADR